MATIREDLRRRAAIASRLAIAGVVLSFVPFFVPRQGTHIATAAIAIWCLVLLLSTAALTLSLNRRLRCPGCHCGLWRKRAYDQAKCPGCGKDFEAPMPH